MRVIEKIKEVLAKHKVKTILDAGFGGGKALKHLSECGYDVIGVDITLDGLIDKSFKDKCLETPLWDVPIDDPLDATICIDVMEHIPPEKVDDTLSELSRLCSGIAILHIALFKHNIGKKDIDKLHLSVFDSITWLDIIKPHFKEVDMRLDFEKVSGGHVTFICKNAGGAI
jgi:SAM-dependent methyltransferase